MKKSIYLVIALVLSGVFSTAAKAQVDFNNKLDCDVEILVEFNDPNSSGCQGRHSTILTLPANTLFSYIPPGTGIHETSDATPVQIFPNPHYGIINVVALHNTLIEIFDLSGNILNKESLVPGKHRLKLPDVPVALILRATTEPEVQYFKLFSVR